MKKQLLIAAVAATMGTAAMADISINGNADFNYAWSEVGTAIATNKGQTEVNIIMEGKTGDTVVHLEQEFETVDGSTSDEGSNANLDLEDMWISTKAGPVNVKMGNWDGSTSAITGNILNNSRSNNKVSLTTTLNDIKLGYWTSIGNGSEDGFTVSGKVAGVAIDVKESSKAYTSIKVATKVAGISLMHNEHNSDTTGKDASFSTVGYTYNGVSLNASLLNGATGHAITENDGFAALYDDGLNDTYTGGGEITKITQVSASMDLAGNTFTLYGVEGQEDVGTTNTGTKVKVTRALSNGMNSEVTYADFNTANATGDTKKFTAKLSVAF